VNDTEQIEVKNTKNGYLTIRDQQLPYEVSEELKVLRTNIQFCSEETKVFLLTSCISGEGKSTTALDLAISLTELNKRVALIDADLRKSVMEAKVENGFQHVGLAHYLSGQVSLPDAINRTNYPNLYVVMAGSVVPPNPSELLSSKNMKALVDFLRGTCDYIIIDAPPIGMVVDAAILAKQADAAIIIVESGEIKYKFAQSAKEKIEATGCPILGVVLNKVDYKKGKYYGKYYDKYYGNYYKHEDSTKTKRSAAASQRKKKR